MKKLFPFRRRQEAASPGSPGSAGRSRDGARGPGDRARRGDLGKIHRAASEGDAAKVKAILLLRTNGADERDQMSRTALHLACANGHPEVVTLLADSKCQLNLCDTENRTALVKAVQCQQEECAAILLEHGADPNVMDIDGNTALHYAVLGENIGIIAKLLSYKATVEAKNKDDLTPLSLAKSRNKEQMVELLLNRSASMHAASQMGRFAVNDESTNTDSLLLQQAIDVFLKITMGGLQKKMLLRSSGDEDFKGKVISQTCTSTEKTSENQSKQTNLPLLHLEKMSQDPEINRECNRDDITYLGHHFMQKYEEMWIKQGELEWRNNLQLVTNELRQKFGEKYNITVCPEEEPLHNSKEGASLRQMPSNLANNVLDCEEKDAFGTSVSAPFQTFLERKEPTLENVFPSYSYFGSPEDSSWSSSSKFCLTEKKLHSENDHKPDTGHVFNKNEESFYHYTKTKKVRNPMVMFEVKEDQEFDMQKTKNVNLNITNWKRGITQTPQSSHLKSHFDLWLGHCNDIKHTIQGKRHDISTVAHTYKETKPNQDLFQKPLYADNCSAGNCKNMKSELENSNSSSSYTDSTPKVYVNEELQQDLQALKNDIDTFKVELLALKKEKVQLQKEVEVEEEKKEQKISKIKVTKNTYKAAGDDGNGLIQQRDCEQTHNQQFPIMENEDSDGSSKEISHDEYKVKEKFNSMDDLSDLTQSTETVSEHGPSPYSNFENFMLLIKQLCKDCKDSDSLYKIQNAVLSYERSIKLGKNQCEVLTKKVKTMENRVSGLHKKLSETREIKSELEHQKVELEQELCNLRFTIKEEKEKRQRADLLYEKIREQLIKKEEQYIKETEMNRELETTLRTLEMELQIVRNTLSQVVEERNETQRLLSQEQNARKLQDENLSHLLCTQKETETACKEINSENDNLTAKLETVSSKCIRLDEKNKLLQQELLSMKAIEKKCEKLDNKNKKLKQEVVKLKRHMEMNMIEYSEVGQYKQKIEEQARQDVADKLKQVNSFLQTQRASKEVSERLIEYHNASIRSHLELRNKDLESELSKMQTSLDYNRRELERYESLYLEELEGRKSLESKLNETNERLAEVRTELLLQKQKDRSVINTLNMRPALEIPSVRDLNSFVPNRNSTPRENLKIPILSPHTSTYVIKMRQEFEETLTRELKEDAAKFESEFYRACPVESIDQSTSRQDLLLKTSQEYTEILKRNYMI